MELKTNVLFLSVVAFVAIVGVSCAPWELGQNDITQIKQDIAELKAENAQLRKELKEHSKLTKSSTDIEELKSEDQRQNDRLDYLEKKADEEANDRKTLMFEGAHRIRRRAFFRRRMRRHHSNDGPEVGFQVLLTPRSTTYQIDDAIKFDHMVTNIGSNYVEHTQLGYNRETGVFGAPYSGTYIFNLNVVSHAGSYTEVSINVNGEKKAVAVSDHRSPSHSNVWDQGSAVALLKLSKGDKVAAVVQGPHGTHDIHGAGKTSFNGYLLRRNRL